MGEATSKTKPHSGPDAPREPANASAETASDYEQHGEEELDHKDFVLAEAPVPPPADETRPTPSHSTAASRSTRLPNFVQEMSN
ncbi:hypothetical protein DL767_004134 [Monosporascus sp. MG133]|nr:hypothetical protein DL767_004134 [Monosporascus sp. MG133]